MPLSLYQHTIQITNETAMKLSFSLHRKSYLTFNMSSFHPFLANRFFFVFASSEQESSVYRKTFINIIEKRRRIS
jgi:hypothetical protein